MSKITFQLNHKDVTIDIDPTKRLLDVLRHDFKLTGPKEGCGEGECGACAVLLNDRVVNSCLVPVGTIMNQSVVTIEGLVASKQGQLLQAAYSKEGAVQCGFCTPGMLIASHGLLLQNPHPSDLDIKIGLSGNLCRCTGYNMIINAVKRAAKEGEGLW
ncbi:(2Fe-2S)-binding protein [Candidatus Xianfuyuplasma coldseepsis]|uniref:(2Fe-2S)-binding protein n=1 Tax=Candidatus Xianfuyuplasma coldseepsis TaxID=2782163 RepID=A0A7L7KQ62_9MOLU|nr:(2Fe-2S)-binding protein [Xianfuyuplasma coldseepsis]QMS84402.1 (2Fe-2S)-binding protein [Xianfuyuplasma coldseepsis]